MDTKRCPKCGETKPATLEFFYASKQTKSGLHGWCKECLKRRQAEYRDADPELNRRRCQDYYRRTYVPHPKRLKTRAQRKEAQLIASREWKRRNWDDVREKQRAWDKAHPEQRRAYQSKRRSLMLASESSYTGADVRRQYAAQKGACYWCGATVGDKFDVDHVIPLSRGGSNGPDNIVVACPSCNRSRHNKLPHEFGVRLC